MPKQLVGEAWINSAEKRRFDVLAASAALPAFVPLGSLCMAATYLSGNKPPIYRQTRVGQHAITFDVLKIRTAPNPNLANPTSAKIQLEPTKVGKVIEKLALDEIPQIVNILRGSMSIVGPRPLVEADVYAMREALSRSEFSDWSRAYLLGRPGIVSEFSIFSHSQHLAPNTNHHKRAELDIAYLEQASADFDRQIIGDTVSMALDLIR